MKKEVVALFIIGVLLVSPFVMAEEQAKVYSWFSRFIDNIRMFFSSGNNKVMLALEIRDKELDSAIINTENGNEENAIKNLERARERLHYVQQKVTKDIAEDVKIDINKTIEKINNIKSENFVDYVLEEEKTQLVVDLVIEIESKEEQILTREIVKDETTGKKKVEIVVEGDNKQERVMEIEQNIQQVQNQIAERIIKTEVASGGGDGNTQVEVASGGGSDDI